MAYQGETVAATGSVNVPRAAPPPVLVAALGLAMLRLAGELADGTVTWMTGPKTLTDHDFMASPFGTAEEQERAARVLGELIAVDGHE